jgi:hypothetical protein
MLRRISEPKWDEIIGGWRKQHNKELHNLCLSTNIIRMIKIKENEIGRSCSMHGGEAECILDFGEEARRKETTRRPQHRWKDNIKIDIREIRWGGMKWFHLAQDRDQWRALVNMAMNLQVI